MRIPIQCLSAVLLLAAISVPAGGIELSGFVASELRLFSRPPGFAPQERNSLSLVAQPEFYHEWDGGNQNVLFVPFARFDSADGERSHYDVRELIWQRFSDDWELRAGIGKVFWGVTESRHLVDIVNQTDLVENIDTEDKLGQPMVNFALIRDWGTLSLFALPGFRERTFPGPHGRLRSQPRVDPDRATFESGAKHRHLDWAARWSHTIGDWDLGLYHFYGTSREPRLLPALDAGGQPVLTPRYDLIHQTGLDVQATKGNWLWKLEAIRRSGQGETFFASVAGFEYTMVGVADSAADLGILFEYLYDDRGNRASQPFEDDAFFGLRLALNDVQSSELLAGVIQDLDGDATVVSIEASRRLGDRWTIEFELRGWTNVSREDLQFSLRNDDHVQITLSRYF